MGAVSDRHVQLRHSSLDPVCHPRPVLVPGGAGCERAAEAHDGPAIRAPAQDARRELAQAWGQGDVPVVVVQLPNCFGPPDPNRPEGEYWWNLLREAQEIAVREIPHTSLAVTIDVGERDVHPKNKVDVGLRMARAALVHVYGKDLLPGGPVYRKHAVEENRIRISFDQVGDGLMVATKKGYEAPVEDPAGKLKFFVVAGEDRKWHWADAVIENDTVVVSCAAVPEPVAVRFAFFQNPEGFNFYNRNGFPAAPFRTDDWSDGIPTPDESIGVWYQGAPNG
jgi:hypothetical protein